jgi:hypothetical protein
VEVRVLSPAPRNALFVRLPTYGVVMTRTLVEVEAALALRSQGLSAQVIGDCLDIPRRTISDWIRGLVPRAPIRGACSTCGNEQHKLDELPLSYVYLLGLYLGDGSIASHARGVFKLRLTLDSAYPEIVAEAARAVGTVVPRSKVNAFLRSSNDMEVYSYSKSWPCLIPQHGPGKKHLRRIALTEWQQRLVNGAPHLLLRGLIQSDGCRFMNTGRDWRYPRYSFTNLSPDIRLIFTNACDALGLHWTTSGRVVYVSRVADVEKMDRFIGPKA